MAIGLRMIVVRSFQWFLTDPLKQEPSYLLITKNVLISFIITQFNYMLQEGWQLSPSADDFPAFLGPHPLRHPPLRPGIPEGCCRMYIQVQTLCVFVCIYDHICMYIYIYTCVCVCVWHFSMYIYKSVKTSNLLRKEPQLAAFHLLFLMYMKNVHYQCRKRQAVKRSCRWNSLAKPLVGKRGNDDNSKNSNDI